MFQIRGESYFTLVSLNLYRWLEVNWFNRASYLCSVFELYTTYVIVGYKVC